MFYPFKFVSQVELKYNGRTLPGAGLPRYPKRKLFQSGVELGGTTGNLGTAVVLFLTALMLGLWKALLQLGTRRDLLRHCQVAS